MLKRTRRLLFWVSVLVFGFACLIAVQYARGNIWDWNKNAFVPTGAVSVRVNVDAALFISDRLVGATSLIGNRVGKDRLAPGAYTVRLVRDGWSSWRKQVEVRAGLLTDFPAVMLLPLDEESVPALRTEASQSLQFVIRSVASRKNVPTPLPTQGYTLVDTQLSTVSAPASPSLIADHVLGFLLSDRADRILWWTRNEIWVRWLRSTDYQPLRAEGETQLITKFSTPVQGAAWFRDLEHIVVDLGSAGYRVVETDTRGGTNIARF